jgi:arginine-tRNA-protein transferase
MDEKVNLSDVLSSPQQEYDALRHVSREFPCSYLPGRMARHEAYQVDRLDGGAYEHLLARGFRRSGSTVYRPRCRGCSECRQIRVLVDQFESSASMRRVLRRNKDVRVEMADCAYTQSKHRIYECYLDAQHDGSMSRKPEAFREFLCHSPTQTLELQYFLGDRLIAVSVADRVPSGLSSVYMYFDPEEAKRSLGTYSILREIQQCRQEKLPYYYLGYLVTGCGKMDYKARFQPYEVLVAEQRWLAFRARSNA